jgi:hypothetical protein
MIDLILVQYEDNQKEVCYAPYLRLKVGDRVKTHWGFGNVLQILSTYKDNEILGIFSASEPLHPVEAVLVTVDDV